MKKICGLKLRERKKYKENYFDNIYLFIILILLYKDSLFI